MILLNGEEMNFKLVFLGILAACISACQCLPSSNLYCDEMKSTDICNAYSESKTAHLILNISNEYASGEKRETLMAMIRKRGIEVMFELQTLPTVSVKADVDQWMWLSQLSALESISLSGEVQPLKP